LFLISCAGVIDAEYNPSNSMIEGLKGNIWNTAYDLPVENSLVILSAHIRKRTYQEGNPEGNPTVPAIW
jgi:hypothetical protein